MTSMWGPLGNRLSTRGRMEQDLGELESSNMDRAYEELEKRRGDRQKPSWSLAFKGAGADDYFQRQADEGDAAFLRSILETGERPRVRVGYAEDETEQPALGGAVQGGPFAARGGSGVQGGPVPNEDPANEIQQLLLAQRLKQQGFK